MTNTNTNLLLSVHSFLSTVLVRYLLSTILVHYPCPLSLSTLSTIFFPLSHGFGPLPATALLWSLKLRVPAWLELRGILVLFPMIGVSEKPGQNKWVGVRSLWVGKYWFCRLVCFVRLPALESRYIFYEKSCDLNDLCEASERLCSIDDASNDARKRWLYWASFDDICEASERSLSRGSTDASIEHLRCIEWCSK